MTAFVFWICVALVLYSLFGYGLIWIVLAWVSPKRWMPDPVAQKATVLIAARNEAIDIGAKIRSVLAQDTGVHEISVLVVSDGSEDGTEEAALFAAEGDERLSVMRLSDHGGKATALNRGLARIAPDEVVIFSDANSILQPGAIRALLDPFSHPYIGGTIGQLSIPEEGGLMARAERLFWRYDNALKAAEDRVAGVVSAQGTLYAVRRELVNRVPGDMADDLAISLGVVAAGSQLAFAPKALATEMVTDNMSREFGRRVRSTERGWRGLMAYSELMDPRNTGLYAIQLISHKFMRRMVAFLLPLVFALNLMLLDQGLIYGVTFLAQFAVYGLAFGSLFSATLKEVPGASAATLFTFGHLAIAYAILRYCVGIRTTHWVPARG